MRDDFVIFILSHGRPDNVRTLKALQRAGNTNRVVIVIDNEDSTADKYFEMFGKDNVVMFDKLKQSKMFDTIDNGTDRRSVVYARNACFDIAEKLGYKYFLELDDDYYNFRQRYLDENEDLQTSYVRDFDAIVDVMLEFLNTTNAKSVAFAQTGDFIGGKESRIFRKKLIRKAMNAFFCDVDKRFEFIGRINEDVNTYVSLGAKGELFFTPSDMCVDQLQTQTNVGGMTELYLNAGTYTKSFFTVVCNPSSVFICTVGTQHPRLHHRIDWDVAVPQIISGKFKKNN